LVRISFGFGGLRRKPHLPVDDFGQGAFVDFRNFLLAAMPPADLAAFGKGLTEVNLTRGQTLIEPGDAIDHIYFPGSACLSVITVMKDGTGVEAATIGRESAVGLIDAVTGQPAEMRTFVQVAGSALRLPAGAYRSRMLQSPQLLALTFDHVRATALQAEQGVACNVAHDVHGRLARWLLMTQDRTGVANFALTQEYMAVMTGVQRSTVSMVAAGYKKAGLINYSRGEVTILDRAGLERQACECYAVVGAAFEKLRAPAR
jgi:CRP-like cAMP-binding protein